MKRDLDLIRQVLFAVEADEGENAERLSEYDKKAVLYHFALAVEAGLLEGKIIPSHDGMIRGVSVKKLTWAGHDFIDAARNEGIWNQAKSKILTAGGAMAFDILKAELVFLVKQKLGIPVAG